MTNSYCMQQLNKLLKTIKIMKSTLTTFILLISLTFFFACTNAQTNGDKLSVNDFEKTLNTTHDAQIVDVRTPEEFNNGHLKNALNIDWNGDKFEAQLKNLDKNKPQFVYCLSGGRSSSAAELMRKEGFKKVYEMKGGMMAWNSANKPVETTTNFPPQKGISITEYNQQIMSDKLVLVDFNAPWCIPCQKMAPMFNKVEEEQKSRIKLLKVNVDQNKELVKTMAIESLPTIILYKNGKEVWKHNGIIEEKELLTEINKW